VRESSRVPRSFRRRSMETSWPRRAGGPHALHPFHDIRARAHAGRRSSKPLFWSGPRLVLHPRTPPTCQWSALVATSSSASAINRRKITHTSTSIWAMSVRSSAPIALRYSVSIRPWVHAKLIRQTVLTVTWIELKRSNAASLVVLPEANHRQARSSCSVGESTQGRIERCRRAGSIYRRRVADSDRSASLP
jgi:hypothetical protein